MSESPVVISFDGHGLRLDTSEDAVVICEQLQDQDVEVLILQGNTFGIEAAERVGLELANKSNLREAHFKDLFTSRGREEVPEALSHLLRGIMASGAELTLLDLSDNAIGPIGAPSVIEFLESPSAKTVQHLYINNCGLGPEGSTSVAKTLSELTELRELIIGRNRLEDKGATQVSMALSQLNRLETLKLPQNGIRVKGIKELVRALEANIETIRHIDLSDNTIKAEGSEALAKVFSKAPNLREIRLDDALLQNEGFSIICDALADNPSNYNLEAVTFEGNELSGQKVVDLISSKLRPIFGDRHEAFTLNLLENEFSQSQLARMEAMRTDKFDILVDEIDSEEEDEDETDNDEDSNGYVDLSHDVSDLREVLRDFIKATSEKPADERTMNSAFIQLISTGTPKNGAKLHEPAQILCEELGLIKLEETRKKNPLARDAIHYLEKRLDELPAGLGDFFRVVVNNNDDLKCRKILFEKLEI